MTKKADLGQELLLRKNATHTLEIEYNTDMEQVFIQLRNKADGKCVVLDADSILEQAYNVLTQKHNDIMTQYAIHMDSETFTGEPEDIARWYCKRRHVNLYIEPNMDAGAEYNRSVLLAAFPDSDMLTHIAYFENDDDNHIENAYRLFFLEYLLEGDKPNNPDYELEEVS